ncbi:MAG: ferredoxin family protein [Thermoguttaceae bacterium]
MTDRLAVIVCGAARGALDRELADALARRPDVELAVLPDLYDLPPEGPAVAYLRSIRGDLVVLSGLPARAAYWVLQADGIRGRMGGTSFRPPAAAADLPPTASAEPGRTIWCLDLRDHASAGPLLQEIDQIVRERAGRPPTGGTSLSAAKGVVSGHATPFDPQGRATHTDQLVSTPQPHEPERPAPGQPPTANEPVPHEGDTRRWYPVVDHSRCENCLECLNFCLFGCYGLDAEGRLFVEQPDACRDGCPACSRICPAGAILFPRHADPAIAGERLKDGPARPLAASPAGESPAAWPAVAADAASLAAAERERALAAGQTVPTAPGQPPAKDDLDRLVDELDRTEL